MRSCLTEKYIFKTGHDLVVYPDINREIKSLFTLNTDTIKVKQEYTKIHCCLSTTKSYDNITGGEIPYLI